MPTPAELIATMARDRLMVASILDGNHANSRHKRAHLWGRILETEILTGSTFLVAVPENNPFIYVGLTQEVIAIPRVRGGGDRFWSYLKRRYGIGESEECAKHVLASYRSYALAEGSKVEMRRFAAYDVKTQTVHLSGYNGNQWRIDGTDIMPINNGEDDIFFIDDDGGVPVVPEVGPNGILFQKLIDPVSFAEHGLGGITAEQMKRMLIVWMFALVFPDLMPTKPLLIVEGAPGSGKSAFCQLLQIALLGKRKPIVLSRNREDDFPVMLLRSPICVFDNLDSYIDWIPDVVCAYTTTGEFPKRKLYTDSDEFSIKPHSFIAVASKNPASFRREDTADRVLVLRLERRDTAGVGFTRFGALMEEFLEIRPQLIGEYMYYVNRIVAEIRGGALAEQQDENFRMADFAALARAVGTVMGWGEGAVEEMLLGIQCEQTSFFNEADPLCDLLNRWIAYRVRGKPSNIGRLIDAFTLHKELESIAQANSISFYKQNAMTQKLRSPHIERDFIVQTATTDNVRTYRFWRKTDARLTSIPMPEDDGEDEGSG